MTLVDKSPSGEHAAASSFGISVVVVAHNEESKISACMASLAALDTEGLKVERILVDDGSTDRTVERARAAAPDLRVVSNPSKSISSNRNCGLRSAVYDHVAFLDADCEAPRHWLRTLARAFDEAPAEVVAVGGANVPPGGESRFYDALALMLNTRVGSRGSVQGMVFDEVRSVDHLPGLNVLYRKSALEAVGGWDERFARIGEDEDLSRRLGDQGFRLLYVPDAVVVHRQRSTWTAWAKNMRTYGKGRMWLLRRHPRAFEVGLLIPPILPLLLWAYLPIITGVALWTAFRGGRPGLWPRLALLYAVTHLCYGWGQWVGLFTAGDSEKSRTRPPKLGLVVLKNAGNLGDAAIFSSVRSRLQRSAPHYDLYVVGLGPSGLDARPVPRSSEGAERVARELLAPSEDARTVRLFSLETWTHGVRLLWTLAHLRILLFCGGQWIHDLKPAYHGFVCTMIATARMLRTRVGVFAVGMGPLRARWSRTLTRLAFGRRAPMVVRDRKSEALCREIGLKQVVLGADPALAMPSRKPPSWDELPSDKPWVGLSPCAWFRFDNVYRRDPRIIDGMVKELLFLVAAVAERGYRVLLIPTMNPEDHDLCRRLLDERHRDDVGRNDGLYLLDTRALSPLEVQGAVERTAFLISMRLHPIIFATNVRTPMAALNYAVKVEEFCRDLGIESQLVELGAEGWSRDALERLDRWQKHPKRLAERIHLGHTAVQERLHIAYGALEQLIREPSVQPSESKP